MVAPFMYRGHADPYDCTRWSETGMKYFLADCGFPIETIRTGSWGNAACIKSDLRREHTLFNRHIHRQGLAAARYPI